MEPGEFLRAHPPFDRLGAADFRALEAGLEIAYRPRGQAILKAGGAESKYLYFVRKGSVRLEREGRVEQVIEVGECFGYPSLIGRASPHADAVAVEDTLLYQFPRPIFERLMTVPSFGEFFLLDLSERLRRVAATEPAPVGGDLTLPARHLVHRGITEVEGSITVGEAARRMREARVSSVLVRGAALGILTDRDLRNRVLAEGRGADAPVADVASFPLKALPADATLFEALIFMIEHDVHHVPLEEAGAIIGMLSDTDLLRMQGKSPLGIRASLDDPGALSNYAKEITGTVTALVAGGLDAAKIGRIVARLNDALVVRLLKRAERDLGPPPCPYSFLVFGSEGRMEQALITDQDNALVYKEESEEAHRYFEELAIRTVDGLLAASFPVCPGGYMATKWRMPLSTLADRFRGWIATPDAAALLDASAFFDYRAVHGPLDLGPLEAALRTATDRAVFLGHLARTALAFEPPLSPFRQIREEDGGVDLKKGGILPIVGMARLYALAAKSPARGTLPRSTPRSTIDRLGAAAAAGTLSADGAATLAEAFRFVSSLRLRSQLAASRAGRPIGNVILSDSLSALERRLLRDTFLAVRELQKATALTFHTDRLG